jgi:uncharacterized protein
MTKTILIFLTIATLTSCSFNKMFLYPDKLQSTATQQAIGRSKDSIAVHFSGPHHQPTFIKNGKDTIAKSFTVESVTFKSSNGNNLNGWFLKPKNTSATVTLLHLHGNAGSLLSQFNAITPLIKNGFQVFMFDYSGFGFSEGKATRKNVLADALSALDYLKTREEIKNTKLVIYGQSLGGHLSAVVAAQRQNEVDGLVIEGAFSSHKDIAAKTVPVLGRIFVKEGYRATKSIKDFSKPVLIIHSTEDETIPFAMGKKIFGKANSPKEFYEVKKCHICAPNYYPDEISAKIKTMLGIK